VQKWVKRSKEGKWKAEFFSKDKYSVNFKSTNNFRFRKKSAKALKNMVILQKI